MSKSNYTVTMFNVKEDQIQSLEYVKEGEILHAYLKLHSTKPKCHYCGGDTRSKGFNDTCYKTLDTNGTTTVVHWKKRRYKCVDCQRSFSEANILGPQNTHVSYTVINKMFSLLSNPHYSFTDVAKEVHLSNTMVQLYFDSYILAPRQFLPSNIGIDEIHSEMAARYGGAYLCTIVDNTGRQLLEVLPNRSKKTLSRYFESIPIKERRNVKYVTIDMWEAYRDVAKKYLPNCTIAVDPFHLVKNVVKEFDRFRVQVMKSYPTDSTAYYLLKKWNRLFTSDVELDNPPRYNHRLKYKINMRGIYELLLQINPSLTKAHYLLEELRLLIENGTQDDCEERFDALYDKFVAANLPCYESIVGMFRHWRTEILNSFIRPDGTHKLSNALNENINSQIRQLIVVSNGLTHFERFRNRALFCFNRNIMYSVTCTMTTNARTGKKRGSYKKK